MNPNGTPRNLKPFPRGVSGNPGGRPKKLPITDRLREICETPLPEDRCRKEGLKPGSTWGELIALRMFEAAAEGNVRAATEIREAIEGKAGQRLETSGTEKREVEIHVVYDQEKRDRSVRETEQVDGLAKAQPTAGKPACRTDLIEPT